MFASSSDIQTLENHIKYVLNATSAGWNGAIDNKARLAEAVTRSRILGTMEVLRAIARNPQHGYWGKLAQYQPIAHGEFLPAHDGIHGVPQIQAFTDAPFLNALPADVDQIDAWRADGNGLHTRVLGFDVAHDQADFMGLPSSVAGFYNITNKVLSFTGSVCRIPLITLTEAMCNTHLPISLTATVVKLAPLFNLREADNLAQIASMLVGEGQKDLMRIEGGAMSVSPVSDVIKVQENS